MVKIVIEVRKNLDRLNITYDRDDIQAIARNRKSCIVSDFQKFHNFPGQMTFVQIK